jgi:heptose I phosphotransferase
MLKSQLQIPPHIAKLLANADIFNALMQLQGKVFRDVPGRKTMQVQLGDKSYFIKQHFGVGWAEIFKNLVSLKLPILGAMTEVHAIQQLDKVGIPTTPLVAYGQQGCSPACFNIATLRSFVLTEDLGDIVSLEDLCADWQANPPPAAFKNKLVIAMAQLAAKLHGALSSRFLFVPFCIKKTRFRK